ncbi:MAG: hypothetical protein ACFFDC_21355, partial [Promethearchaeota archaeon]
WQELGYNQNSPIWGINPIDPHVMYPGEYPDSTPPEIYIDSPAAIIYSTGTIDISLSSNIYPSWSLIEDAKHYWYYIEGIDSENQSWSPSAQKTLDDGTYTLHAYGNDSLGNEAHTSVTFTINAVLPSVIIDLPSAATYSTSVITIEFSGTANYFWYYIEGADTSNRTWTSSVERSFPDGTYTLNAYGNDSEGSEVHTSVTFTINAILPSVIIDSPVAGTYSTSEITIELSGTASNFWYYIEGVDTNNQTWTSSVERSLPDGTYTLNAYGNDAEGSEVHASVIFTIDAVHTSETLPIDTSSEIPLETTSETTPDIDDITPTWTLPFIFLTMSILFLNRRKNRKEYS